MKTRIALYITTPSFTSEHLSALLQSFDTAQTEYPLDPFPDYIRPRLPFPFISSPATSQPDSPKSSAPTPTSNSSSTTNWALGLSQAEIWARHTAEWHPANYANGEQDEWAHNPIVVVDDRTVRDGSVLVVDTDYEDGEEMRQVLKGVRFESVYVPVAVANLEIANLMLSDVSVVISFDRDVLGTWMLIAVLIRMVCCSSSVC